MLFTIVFNEYGLTLDTTDMETAFHACEDRKSTRLNSSH